MNALQAHIALPEETADRRRASRRTLSLGVPATTATHEMSVVISNLSRTGLLIETDTDFAIGEIFLLVLPEIGATPVRIRWRDAKRFGCEFLSPVTSSAVSAAQLKAPHDEDALRGIEAAAPDAQDTDWRAPPKMALVAMVTFIFAAGAVLFLFALASLNFAAD